MNTTDREVTTLLSKSGIYFSCSYVGESNNALGSEQTMDHWSCDFADQVGNVETFDYYTGLGHRVSGAPTAPTPAAVLNGLFLDAAALAISFDGWCAEYGYDTDSRKALRTYQACRTNDKKLSRVIPEPVRAQLQELLQDY